jgi:hypothetical protein
VRDLFIVVAAAAQDFDFVADHAHEGRHGEHLLSHPRHFAEGFLGAQGFFERVDFFVGVVV